MLNDLEKKAEEKSLILIKKVLISLGGAFITMGVIRQWPIAEKSYMDFFEGKGYLSLMLGLIMIVLGVSVKLLIGQKNE